MHLKKCKGCDALITFIKTPEGKWIPVEPINIFTPNQGGKVVTTKGIVLELSKQTKSIRGHRPHWGNCPAEAQFRKPKEDSK